ncbi:hypothetical protein RUND412_000972 [Rhizina undulata]
MSTATTPLRRSARIAALHPEQCSVNPPPKQASKVSKPAPLLTPRTPLRRSSRIAARNSTHTPAASNPAVSNPATPIPAASTSTASTPCSFSWTSSLRSTPTTASSTPRPTYGLPYLMNPLHPHRQLSYKLVPRPNARSFHGLPLCLLHRSPAHPALTQYPLRLEGAREGPLDTDHMVVIFRNQGRYDEALEYLNFKNQGRYDEALEWHRRSLAEFGEELGIQEGSPLNHEHS